MKKIYSCLIILTFFTSCSSDEKMGRETTTAMSSKGISDLIPANAANPFDNAGQIYDELFSSFYDGSIRPTSVQGIINQVETIAHANSSFEAINTSGYEVLNSEHIVYLAKKGNFDIGVIIGASKLSPNAKISFGNFLISYVNLYASEINAADMVSAVIKFEDTILPSSDFTETDKRVMLTSTSILRYRSYRAKKRPKKNTDPDWIISVGHAIGTEDGAEDTMAKAVLQGLVTGIVSNK